MRPRDGVAPLPDVNLQLAVEWNALLSAAEVRHADILVANRSPCLVAEVALDRDS
jgi:hypothetical protein